MGVLNIRGVYAPWLTAISMVVVSTAVIGAESEDIFHDALRYTVQIRTGIAIPYEGERKGTLLGAGFVVDSGRRWIVTNAHVAGRSPSNVEVAFYERDFVQARKVYVDPFIDLAVLEVGGELQSARAIEAQLQCNDRPQVGHPVGAFGHPYKFKFSGTRGIVSGTSSQTETEMLQTDAPINPGNSGGPLISLNTGRVVGVNTETRVQSQNTNFALPMPYVCRVLDLLKAGKDPSPPVLPFAFFSDSDAKQILRVARIHNVPDALSLVIGDEIVGVAGHSSKLENETQLVNDLRGSLEETRLMVMRDGHRVEVTGRIQQEELVIGRRTLWASGVLFGRSPAALKDLDIKLPPIAVEYVEDGSRGEFQRFESNSFVALVDGKPVQTLDELKEIIDHCSAANRPVKFLLYNLKAKRSLFGYVERTLRVDDLKWVGDSGTSLAASPQDQGGGETSLLVTREERKAGLVWEANDATR